MIFGKKSAKVNFLLFLEFGYIFSAFPEFMEFFRHFSRINEWY